VLAEQLVEPTIINPDHSKTIDDDESLFSVDSNGDLVLKIEANENSAEENDQSRNESNSEENTDKEI